MMRTNRWEGNHEHPLQHVVALELALGLEFPEGTEMTGVIWRLWHLASLMDCDPLGNEDKVRMSWPSLEDGIAYARWIVKDRIGDVARRYVEGLQSDHSRPVEPVGPSPEEEAPALASPSKTDYDAAREDFVKFLADRQRKPNSWASCLREWFNQYLDRDRYDFTRLYDAFKKTPRFKNLWDESRRKPSRKS